MSSNWSDRFSQHLASRPLGITIVAGIYLLLGIFALLRAAIAVPLGVVLCLCNPGIVVGGVAGLVTGILYVVFGGALWSGRKWAYWLIIILVGLTLIGQIFNGIAGNGFPFLSILWNIFVIWYMQTPGVKRFFEQVTYA